MFKNQFSEYNIEYNSRNTVDWTTGTVGSNHFNVEKNWKSISIVILCLQDNYERGYKNGLLGAVYVFMMESISFYELTRWKNGSKRTMIYQNITQSQQFVVHINSTFASELGKGLILDKLCKEHAVDFEELLKSSLK